MLECAVFGNTADDRGAVRAGDDGGDTLAGCHARAGFRPVAADLARSDLDRGGCDRVGRVPRRLLVQPRRAGGWGADRKIQRLSQPRNRIERRSEEHTSELQSLMRISYAVFCLKKKKKYSRKKDIQIKNTSRVLYKTSAQNSAK